ncbi:hypothetical protein BCR44DRAFT_272149 [Catenaria anguillulae PL171]|uniref:Uncharacterized protein n=1 Tax=Catenaria anguillulae PL171 TaxID=765915 RepID=A0A1Y2HPI0_9FUNG|nr:hypothetical protein BCR44DRAFT_272149 [Catenaria anguillulae PL171]
MVVYWFDGDHGDCWPLDPLMILEKGQMLPEPTPPIHPAHLDFCGHKPPSVEIPLLNAGDAGYVAVVDSDPVACKEIRADAYVQAKTLARDGLYCPHGFLSFDEWVREMLRYARCRRCDEAAVIDWHEKCAKLALTGAAMPAGPRFAIHARMHQLRHGHVECRNHERHKTSKSRSMSWYQVFDWLWAVWIHHFKCPYRIDDERPSVSSPPAPTVKKVRKATTPAALRGLAASAIIDFTSRHLRSRPGQAGHESETELHPHSGFKDSDYHPGKDGVTGDSSSSDDEEQGHAQPFVRRTDAVRTALAHSVFVSSPLSNAFSHGKMTMYTCFFFCI